MVNSSLFLAVPSCSALVHFYPVARGRLLKDKAPEIFKHKLLWDLNDFNW